MEQQSPRQSTPVFNIRLIILHSIAAWLFHYAFLVLGSLYNIPYIEAHRNPDPNVYKNFLVKFSADGLTYMVLIPESIATGGLIIASLISFFIARRFKWHGINAIIVFVLLYILGWFNWDGWSFLKHYFLMPGQIFTSIFLEILINGLLMLAAGLLIFFLPAIIRFIQKGQRA